MSSGGPGIYKRRCKACNAKLCAEIHRRHRIEDTVAVIKLTEELDELYKEHICSYSELQQKRMTEAQWYSIMRHFGGCVICGNPIIQRTLMVRPSLGGKYTQHNVLPFCDEHSALLLKDRNPFAALHPTLNKKKTTDVEYKKFVDSMQLILKEVI